MSCEGSHGLIGKVKRMHIIDSHTHVDEYEAFGWFDPPEAIIELLDEAGIEQAVSGIAIQGDRYSGFNQARIDR